MVRAEKYWTTFYKQTRDWYSSRMATTNNTVIGSAARVIDSETVWITTIDTKFDRMLFCFVLVFSQNCEMV